MLGDITVAENIYIACGYTDMRKSIDGLAAVVQEQFHLDPFSSSLFFCGKSPYLENYLLDGRCALSNNTAENAIRSFIVGRKNWLFSDTPKGASATAAVCSIVETAKVNGLNVFTYLEYPLMYMPDTDWKNHPEDLDDLIPWSETV